MQKSWLTVLTVGIFSILALILPAPKSNQMPVTRHYRIEASQFAFTPGTLRVNPGDRVIIDFIATDVVHGLYIDSYGISTTADPGRPSRISFTADHSGSFRYRCSVACGDMHPFMIGKLQVGTNWMLWRGLLLMLLITIAGLGFALTKKQ
ncbi:MAG: cupredoxin domain-containing protein [Anaerolineae bacterium]|nr:cupredoxin domain-containing protein [Anaerolineae bacterium]